MNFVTIKLSIFALSTESFKEIFIKKGRREKVIKKSWIVPNKANKTEKIKARVRRIK